MRTDEEGIGAGLFVMEVWVCDGSSGESTSSLAKSVRDGDLTREREGVLDGEEDGELSGVSGRRTISVAILYLVGVFEVSEVVVV